MPDVYLQKIIDKCKKNNPGCDAELIGRAYEFAKKIHAGQKRASGEDYIFHCLGAAEIVAELKVDSKTIAATLLHDVIDDGPGDKEELEKQVEKAFGKEITRLVNGITKLGKIKYRGAQRQIENLRKMFLVMAQDIRVVIIKLADRLHNMNTLSFLPPVKQQRIASETMNIYAPIADRLGIGHLKGDLEDLSFRYLMPGEYQWLANQVRDRMEEREKYLNKIIPDFKKEMLKEGVGLIGINWRAKHYWSLYKKLQRYEMNLNKIYDLVALRVVVKDIDDCYATLGLIHKLWRPLPGRIKDYIALPKPNGYQSLHTTVFCYGGKITEIQIRTAKMDEEAERGIAAHWYYSEQKGIKTYIKKIFTPAPEKELRWIKQLRDWQKETESVPEEFFQSLKIDFFKDRIFVFTPMGDVVDLPEGATPLDFAFHIHSDVGQHCQGAKVDGKMVALNTPLHNGQVVEIITQKNARPSRDWLKIAKTNQALGKIRQWLSKDQKRIIGEVDEIIKKEPAKQEPAAKPAGQAVKLKPIVEVAGDQKIAALLAKCCRPQPPDEIVGYITLNQRITVHRKDCRNAAKAKDPKRLVSVSWKA
ncbi:MAG: RelA/SpoT family protein [Candidatus Portnoybacteria bacterium]|nr:RelA/SpoT family protein [Candidatus Portnoybacteria bacterium]MDD4982623.1 RelA/SpoT family protein [Candidatus Portnoybacteria bacterium]